MRLVRRRYDLRHAEYYGMQPTFDELYQRSRDGGNFDNLMDLILSRDNILLAYRNIKANGNCRISLFSAQHGRCAISGEEFTDASRVVGWLKTPKDKGGFERYGNMVLIHERHLQLLQDLGQQELKATAKTIKATKKMISKINRLREQAELLTIG